MGTRPCPVRGFGDRRQGIRFRGCSSTCPPLATPSGRRWAGDACRAPHQGVGRCANFRLAIPGRTRHCTALALTVAIAATAPPAPPPRLARPLDRQPGPSPGRGWAAILPLLCRRRPGAARPPDARFPCRPARFCRRPAEQGRVADAGASGAGVDPGAMSGGRQGGSRLVATPKAGPWIRAALMPSTGFLLARDALPAPPISLSGCFDVRCHPAYSG